MPRNKKRARARKKRGTRPSGGYQQPSRAHWNLRRFDALSDAQRDTYFRAKRVIKEIRSGKSASQAARDNKTTLPSVRRYFPADLFKKRGSGRWQVAPSDLHPNEIQYLGASGYKPWVLRGSKEVSRYAAYLNDVKRALREDASALDKWKGKKIGGRALLTNLKTINRLAEAGELDFGDELEWRS